LALGHVDGGREAILVLDQEPLLRILGAYERERTLDLFAAKQDAQLAFRETVAHLGLRALAVVKPCFVVFVGRIHAAVPNDDFARAVLTGWNHALEGGIVVRVILGLDREPLLVRV